MITFDDWAPDRGAPGNPGLVICRNALPGAVGFRPMAATAPRSVALPQTARGASAAIDGGGNVTIVAGTDTALYRLTGTTWTAVSRPGGYILGATERWSFTQFGNRVIACGIDQPIQGLSFGDAAFADLVPDLAARHVAVVRSFVVLGNVQDTVDGATPQRVRWSAIADETDWTPSEATLAGFQDLLGLGGSIQAVVGGETGTIFQERAIWRMSFIGSPFIFQFDEIERTRGALCPGGVVAHGGLAFFLAADGFYAFDGGSVRPIGADRVDRSFLADFDQAYMDRMWSAVDPVNKLVFWAYPGAGHVDGQPNRMLVYRWANDRWGQAEIGCDVLLRGFTPGYRLEDLDTVSTSLDALTDSLDSRAWSGGAQRLAAIDTAGCFAFFDGAPLAATLGTGESQLAQGRRGLVTGVRPVVDAGSSVTLTVAARARLADPATATAPAAMNAAGWCPVRAEGRYHRFTLEIAGGFETALGLELEVAPLGTA